MPARPGSFESPVLNHAATRLPNHAAAQWARGVGWKAIAGNGRGAAERPASRGSARPRNRGTVVLGRRRSRFRRRRGRASPRIAVLQPVSQAAPRRDGGRGEKTKSGGVRFQMYKRKRPVSPLPRRGTGQSKSRRESGLIKRGI